MSPDFQLLGGEGPDSVTLHTTYSLHSQPYHFFQNIITKNKNCNRTNTRNVCTQPVEYAEMLLRMEMSCLETISELKVCVVYFSVTFECFSSWLANCFCEAENVIC